MEIEALFTSSKWDILQKLADKPYSPLELAELLKTTMANVSQQLRLLEFAGLVNKERISNRDKGKPRMLYSLAKDNAYLVALTKGFAEKKMFALTKHHKALMKIWFIDNPELQFYYERFFFELEHYLDYIEAIGIDPVKLQFNVISKTEELKKLNNFQIKNPKGEKKKVVLKIVTKIPANNTIIYTNS